MGIIDIGTLLLFVVLLSSAILFLIFKGRFKRICVHPELGVEEVHEPVVEEELPEVEEVHEPVVEEESKQSLRKRTRREPIDRGGRPRSSEVQGDAEAQRYEQYWRRPEIICWQRERQWNIGVEVPEDLINKDLEICQNDSSLLRDEYIDCCWVLEAANIPVEIRWEKEEEYQILLGDVDYIIFKLIGSEQNKGCCVRSSTFGSYLVVVPETWERDNELSGSPPVSPQYVSLKGYRGHFFNLEKGDDKKIAFRNEKEKLMIVESKGVSFEIVGNLLNDSSEKLGPLFGDGPIKIRSINGRVWGDIGTLVIGEEGSGRGRWRTAFSPIQNVEEQELPSEVLSRKGGWYFIRFYDMNDSLIESLDFRFVSELKDIKILQSSIFPSEEGHSTGYVEFSHDLNFNIEQKFTIEEGIEISREVNTTKLSIPPRDIFDATFWIVGSHNGPQVDVNILIERVWWGIGDEDEPPSEWKDKPITLSRDDFSPTSNKAIYLRFPKPRWIDTVSVGFERDRASSFNVSVGERMVGIPLRGFGDYAEVENEDQDAHLLIWLNRGAETYESKLALLTSNAPVGIGLGRKRRAIAEATLIKGSSQIIVNDDPLWEYFDNAPEKAKIFMRRLLKIEEVSKVLLDFQVRIIVIGSGPDTMQQAKAATHALSRALMDFSPELKRMLKRMNDFGGVRVRGLPTRRKE